MNAFKNLKENWLVLLIVAVFAVGSGVVTANITKRTDRLDNAASVEYVDNENKEQDDRQSGVNARQDRELLYLNENKAEKAELNSIHQDVREIRETQIEMMKILIDLKDK